MHLRPVFEITFEEKMRLHYLRGQQGLMLVRRRRRWDNINQTLGPHFHMGLGW